MGEGAREREREEEEEEEEVEEVEDIFRAAPNQLLRQFVSVGAKGRARERERRKFNTKNQYAAHSLTESSSDRGSEEESERQMRLRKWRKSVLVSSLWFKVSCKKYIYGIYREI